MEYYINGDFGLFYTHLQYQYYNHSTNDNNFLGIFIDLNNCRNYYNNFIYKNYRKIPDLPNQQFTLKVLNLNIQPINSSKNNNSVIHVPEHHINPNINNIVQKIIFEKSIIFQISHKNIVNISLKSIQQLNIKFTKQEHTKYKKIKHFIDNPYFTLTLFNQVKSSNNCIFYNSQVINHNIMIEMMKFLYRYFY